MWEWFKSIDKWLQLFIIIFLLAILIAILVLSLIPRPDKPDLTGFLPGFVVSGGSYASR